MIRKMFVVATAVAMPLGAIAAFAGTAAAKGPPDTGSITCSGSSTATLVPAFHDGGTMVTKSTTTLSSSTSSCTGNTPTSVVSAAAAIKSKYPKPGKIVADCKNLTGTTIGAFTIKAKFSDKTSSTLSITGGGPNGGGFKVSGTVTKGSFLGETVSIQSDLSSADVSALLACGSGGPDVGTLHLTNTISIPAI